MTDPRPWLALACVLVLAACNPHMASGFTRAYTGRTAPQPSATALPPLSSYWQGRPMRCQKFWDGSYRCY